MSDNMNGSPQGFTCIYSLLTSDTCNSVLCLKHPKDGYIAVDKDLSNIYISVNELIALNNSAMSVSINYSEGGNHWSTTPLQFGVDNDLASYVSISNCGQQYVIAIDISQVPIKRGICIQNCSEPFKVQYGDAIYGHYHCNTEFSTGNTYSDSNITYGQVCNSLQSDPPEPPPLNSVVDELEGGGMGPSKLPISRDYLCIPELDKPTQSDICSYCIAMMHDSHYLFSANKDQLPMKYIYVSDSSTENMESIFTKEYEDECDWCTDFNSKGHIYDGDLPYIDIQLLCQSSSGYKLPTNMIPYDTISFSNGVVSINEGNCDNSVTASNLASILIDVRKYISNYMGNDTGGN